MEGTDSIRSQATKWTLAGDHNLFDHLQNMHQKIVSKCQEVNTKLDKMASTLDDASINLQNVNNKFMSLSNSQFIESRVYDDDADVTTGTNPAEEPSKSESLDEISLFKQSLEILDSAHETAEILDDSDTDDSDAEISVVLKPKDAYAHRPLPHIIGSQAWKNKWHAGLIVDSDSDSSTSRPQLGDIDQYSESEEDIRTDRHVPDTTISESSSSLHSERERETAVPDKRTPADIAAELAARLRNSAPVVEDLDDMPPQPAFRSVHRPQQPITSTIFFDEPPPIDPQNEEYSSDSQEESDIFAEINKKQPYSNKHTAQDGAADLFGGTYEDFSGFTNNKLVTKAAHQKSTLFDDESEPEMFVEKPTLKTISKESSHSNKKVEDNSTKKPVGGISLFGSNKGTESIGAAILKRNRRKSSLSENESDDNTRNPIENEPAANKRKNSEDRDITASNANAIFDHLFAKAKQAEQKLMKPAKIDKPVEEEKPKPKEVKYLFSDNIFDDVDDIFTSDIKIPKDDVNKNAKSIFDDNDDDDLFSDIAKKPKDTKATSIVATSSSSLKKSIFDSDDDLFSDVEASRKTSIENKHVKTEIVVATESLANKPVIQQKNTISKDNNKEIKYINTPEIVKESIYDDFSKIEAREPKAKSKSIFESDSDDDLFSNVQIKTTEPKTIQKSNKNSIKIYTETDTEIFEEITKMKPSISTETLKRDEKTNIQQSPSLFEEDEIDDLFINANKTIKQIVPEDKPSFKERQKNPLLDVMKAVDNSDIKKENQNPVFVDTKPFVVHKIDKAETETDQLFNDNLLTKPKETDSANLSEHVLKDDVIEEGLVVEPVKVQIKSSSIDVALDSKLQDKNTTDITIDNSETRNVQNDAIITEPQRSFFSDMDAFTNQLDSKVNKNMLFEVPVNEKQDIIPDQKNTVPLAAALDTIFSEPPAFEKTKETKKTTNVNALFEDDSDDESLFFKKNDIISDEKPEIFSPKADFGLFNDEPPALDVDFTPNVNKHVYSDHDDNDLFRSVRKKEVHTNLIRNEPPKIDEWYDDPKDDTPIIKSKNSSPEISKTTIASIKEVADSDDELFSNTPKVPEISQKENISNKSESKTKEVGTDQVDEITKHKEFDTNITETKKIGKLNTKNLNINVQALVPGASPKKIPTERSVEEFMNITKAIQNVDNSSKQCEESKTKKYIEEGLTEIDNAEPQPVKSLSFENKPEAGILDNNLSKQRAKIQVKRRPSTRRARHEAARKSVIDFDDDTDNSSSFDEPKPKTNQDSKINERIHQNDHEIFQSSNRKISTKSKNQDMAETENFYKHKTTKNDNTILKSDENDGQRKAYNIHDEITNDAQMSKITDEVDSTLNSSNVKVNEPNREDLNQEVPTSDNSTAQNEANVQKSPPSTTKVVYILNDEDIFKTSKETADATKMSDDDLFTIKTIGNTYRESTKNIEAATTKIGINIATSKQDTNKTDSKQATKNKETIKTVKESSKNVPPKKDSKSLFDLSDDDDDLFGKSTKSRKIETKSKLFESDSEEDLFSGKKENFKKVDEVTNVVKAKGSLFGDNDDDEDLFGVKSKTQVSESKMSSKKPTTSKDPAKSTKIVFDDPLSMLDDA